MKNVTRRSVALLFGLLIGSVLTGSVAHAATFLRWTYQDSRQADLPALVARVNAQSGLHLTPADFVLDEDRRLAFNQYKRYSQTVAGVRVKNASIRIWSAGSRGDRLVQAEANVEDPAVVPAPTNRFLSRMGLYPNGLRDLSTHLTSTATLSLARAAVTESEDAQVRGVAWRDFLVNGALQRDVLVTAKRGEHTVTIDVATQRVVHTSYRPFPNVDEKAVGIDLRAKVFPVYEEFRGQRLDRKDVVLKNVLTSVKRPGQDPFVPLTANRRFLYSMYDAVKAQTPEGQALGYWSDAMLRQQVKGIVDQIPESDNNLQTGLLLQGKYVTININPEAFKEFQGISFAPEFTSQQFWLYKDVEVNGQSDTELIPSATYFGKAIHSAQEIESNPANRDPAHNPVTYINEGFDEIQVYYAVSQLFDALRPMGFIDPDLSTRPFNAILFDPDIAMRDNAYYTADTINFTTYSPTELNYARDNTTIWHELGHGVMDRLMGDFLSLADTGGLSEGMADFVAELVLQAATSGVDFPGKQEQRIINRTGFYLTNEVHDDGEAYGGVMKDILDRAIAKWGHAGLVRMTDLTMETMRLTRDHPHLTAKDWFDHMKFADDLGRRGVRTRGEMRPLIDASLASRNFSEDPAERGTLTLSYDGSEVVAGKPGSRGNSIPFSIGPAGTQDLSIKVKVADGSNFQFKYPVTLRAFFRTGPLQGAVHWTGEEATYQDIVVNSSGEEHDIPLQVSGTCDEVNRDDGSCVDFVYVQVLNQGEAQAVAKKRFYVRVRPTL